jgi:hypothetical protein
MKPATRSEKPVILEGNYYDNRNNIIEKDLMINITNDIISNKTSKHFLLMYFHSICDDTLKPKPKLQDDMKPTDDLPVSIVMYTEPATGDIIHLFEKTFNFDDATISNILIQAIISLGTFHNTYRYIHSDCHMGNFLYQNNSEKKETGYYSYSLKNLESVTYSLKSCDYNIMIYDFGKSIKIDIDINNKFELYAITNAIIEGIIIHELFINFKVDSTDKVITYDDRIKSFKAGNDVINMDTLNDLIKKNKYKCINGLIKLDYILLIQEFEKVLVYRKYDNSIFILNNFLEDIKKIEINEINIDTQNIFREVIQLYYQHYHVQSIFNYGKPDNDTHNIINSSNSYKI